MDDSIGGSWHSPGAPTPHPRDPPLPPGLARLSPMLRFAYALGNIKNSLLTRRGAADFSLYVDDLF